jgi:hypothetical protein
MFRSTPPNTRFLAHSTRSYKGSSPFTTEHHSSGQATGDCLGDDLASIIAMYIEWLSPLSHHESSIKLICWSLGGGSVLSAFSLLAQKRLFWGNEKAVCASVSEIIFYEPRVNGVLNLQPSPSTITERAEAAQKNENPLETFLSRVAGLYDYPADFLEGIKAGVRD